MEPITKIRHWLSQRTFFWLNVYARFLSLLRPLRAPHPPKSALFVPPDTVPGSLGDEAMLVGGTRFLRDRGFEKIGIVSWGNLANWDYLQPIDAVVRTDERSIGYWHFINQVSHYSHLYCTGADMMDGYYSDHATLRLLKLAALAAKTGAKVSFLGFSFNENPTPAAVQALTNLPASVRLCCRDPFSHQRFGQHVSRSANLVADVAFLLQPVQNTELALQMLQWVQTQQTNGRTVIGININNLFLRNTHQFDAKELVQIYATALTELFASEPNLSFLMMPHDMRGDDSDVSLAADLLAALPAALQPYCAKVPFPCSAAEIKAICAAIDLVLTGRMHLAIACLGQGTPVAGITYQGKFEGLFHDFGLQGVTISPAVAFQPGQLAQFFRQLIPQRQQLRQQIQAALPNVQKLSAFNFANAVFLGEAKSNEQKAEAHSLAAPMPPSPPNPFPLGERSKI